MRGIISGTERENFFTENVSKNNNKKYRSVRFGIEVEKGMLIFLEVFDMERDNVSFFDKEGERIEVPWGNRFSFRQEGARLGNSIALGITKNEDGKNDTQYMTLFDGAEYMKKHMKDGMSVFIRGNIEFSHYTGRDGNLVRTQRLVPKGIYLANEPINFDDEGFTPRHKFTQDIIFDGIEIVSEGDKKEAIVSSYFVNYGSVEHDDLVIRDKKLATKFQNSLGKYDKISVHGDIISEQEVEEVAKSNDDVWGEENDMGKTRTPYHRVFLIRGASGDTLETDIYDENSIENALSVVNRAEKAEKEFGSEEEDDDSWGDEDDSFEDEEW